MIAPVMIRCILHGITTYLLPRQPPYDFSQHPNNNFLQLVRWAYCQQSQSGWSNLLCSRLASSWLCAHDKYHRQCHLHARHSRVKFAPAFVQSLWSFSLTIWHQRNQDVHGATVANFNAIQQAKINRKSPIPTTTLTSSPLPNNSLSSPNLFRSNSPPALWYSFYESCLNAPKQVTDSPAPPPPELAALFRPFQQHYRRMAAPPDINPFNPAT